MSWSEFVSRVIGTEAHEKVGAKIGVSGPTVGRWINGSTGAPRVEVAVKFARAYGVPVLETFVEAGYITRAEAGARPTLRAVPEPAHLTNDELLRLVRSRMREEGEQGGDAAATSPPPAAGPRAALDDDADRPDDPED